ncbi:MAG: hypothetical protein JO138_18190 [Acidobacteriaceae bacterium]|nr:hypothetical protein [Acidobacteriaceae bacterium]
MRQIACAIHHTFAVVLRDGPEEAAGCGGCRTPLTLPV